MLVQPPTAKHEPFVPLNVRFQRLNYPDACRLMRDEIDDVVATQLGERDA